MITKNTKFGNVDNVTIVEFGKGTVVINGGQAEDNSHKSIFLKTRKDGWETEDTETSDGFKPEVVLVFHNESAFRVFEEFVKNIRTQYNWEKE